MPKSTPLKLTIVSLSLSQTKVSRCSGVDLFRLNRILNGRVEPKDYELKRITEAIEHLKSNPEASRGSEQKTQPGGGG